MITKVIDFLENSGSDRKFLSFLRFIVRLINFLIPKRDNQIIFESTPDFSDNSSFIWLYKFAGAKIQNDMGR